VSVDSAVGQGTTFTVRVPVHGLPRRETPQATTGDGAREDDEPQPAAMSAA
jgi:hypothetical protein